MSNRRVLGTGGGGYQNGGTGTSNVVPKGNGAGALQDSSITDNGTVISSAEPIQLGNGTVSAPSYSFTSGTGSGLFWSSTTANHPEISSEGTSAMSFFNNGVRIKVADNFSWSSTSATTGGADTNISRRAAGVIQVGTASIGSAGTIDLTTVNYRGLAQTYFVTSNFTSAGNTNLQAITGLSFTFPANIAMNVGFEAHLLYSQATAAVAIDFGFQDVTVAPTSASFTAQAYTNTGVVTEATLQNSATTTATSIISITPSAISTIWQAHIQGFIEQPSNASTSVFQLMIKTANASDLPTVYRGSWMRIQQ